MFGKATLVFLDQLAANSDSGWLEANKRRKMGGSPIRVFSDARFVGANFRLPKKGPNGKPVSLVCFAYFANTLMPCR